MKTLKEKENKYNILPKDAIITKHTMIPGINGRKINLSKSYHNMKRINKFTESLLIFEEIKPNKTINHIYDKVIIGGNFQNNIVSVITNLDHNYCYTMDLYIKKECIQNKKYTILIHKISYNHLTNIKSILKNGIVIYLDSINNDELNVITKYIRNNNFEIVPVNKLLNIS